VSGAPVAPPDATVLGATVLDAAEPVRGAGAHAFSGGAFEPLGELGRGGMGIVYRARQKSLDREVAVKRVLQGSSTEETRRSFVSEALVTGALVHPNVVPVHALGRFPDGDAFLAMK